MQRLTRSNVCPDGTKIKANASRHSARSYGRIETLKAQFQVTVKKLEESVGKPLTVILDHASIHKARAIQSLLAFLKKRGLTLHFLLPYSPELKRIEKLCHKMKFEWMAFKVCNTATFEADVDAILDGFGSKYRMTLETAVGAVKVRQVAAAPEDSGGGSVTHLELLRSSRNRPESRANARIPPLSTPCNCGL